MAKKITAIKVMMVVFFTSVAVGHETRRISARVSRTNCEVRWKKPVRGPISPRSRRALLPSAPSPNLAARGDGVPMGFTTEVSRAGAGSGSASKFSDSFSSIDTDSFYTNLAGVPGFEPGLSVLETDVLTVDTIPLGIIADCQFPIANLPKLSIGVLIGNCQLAIDNVITWFPYDPCAYGSDYRTS
jgi:hypothetical protein